MDDPYTAREWQVNYFAWAFLMPKGEFMKVIKENTDSKNNVRIENVAEHFCVSESAVVNYGRMLGIFR